MKLVQGKGLGPWLAGVEEMWLKRTAQAVADCVGEGTEAGVDSPVALEGFCLTLKQFLWLMGKLNCVLSHSLVCQERKGYFGTHGKICLSFASTSVCTGKEEVKTAEAHTLCFCS